MIDAATLPAWLRRTPGPHDDAHRATDIAFMRHALALGRRNLGATWPNPSVGAVLVRDFGNGPVVVGRGMTQPGGRPHGEAVAFQQAGELAAGATLYVTLEPCTHRTVRAAMPCCEWTIRAGIRRVVTSMADPNPRIAGLGHALLRTAGIAVETGVLANEAARAHRGHVSRLTRARPMLTYKVARTADGYAGGVGGTRVAISCEHATRWVHLLRARHDAIMLGIGSVLADDPLLNVRLPGLEHRSPVRIVLDSRLRLPPGSALVRTARDIPLWVVTTADAPVEYEQILIDRGVEVMRVGPGTDGHLDLREALALFATRGITRVFSEGGPGVGEALCRDGLIDEAFLSASPRRLDAAGVIALGPRMRRWIDDPERSQLVESRTLGEDRLDHYERIEACSPA